MSDTTRYSGKLQIIKDQWIEYPFGLGPKRVVTPDGKVRMTDFVPGQRYPVTEAMAAKVMAHAWPAATGQIDITRGRLFVGSPCKWQFWLPDGRRVDFEHDGVLIVSVTKEADPERPEPLPVVMFAE